MRKIALLMALLLLAASVSMAASVQPKVGLKGGLVFSNLGGGDADELFMDEAPTSKMGLGVGLFVGIPVGALTIQPELLYVQKGATADYEGTGWEATATASVDYLEIPVLLKFSFGETETKPYLIVGPSLGILMSAKVKYEVEVEGFGSESDTDDIKDEMTSTDLGLVIGAGVDIKQFVLEARYELGLNSVADPEETTEDVDVKNSAVMLMVGYSFN